MDGTPDGNDPPVALPSAQAFAVSETITIQPPLTRRGHGPALIILVPTGLDVGHAAKTIDPPPLQKWAEEGFTVAQIQVADSSASTLKDNLRQALDACSSLKDCDEGPSIGLVCEYHQSPRPMLAWLILASAYGVAPTKDISSAIDESEEIAAVILYGEDAIQTQKPQLRHVSQAPPTAPSRDPLDVDAKRTFYYPNTGKRFVIPAHKDFRAASAAVAHTRCLTFLKPIVGGPYFDLEAIWEEHTFFEFAERAVEKTMGTMVQEPYVNHIPTMTGGIGRDSLTNFYRHHFVFNNPADTNLELVSRTVGIDRVIDEFVASFTHDRMIDWMYVTLTSLLA